MADHFDPKVKIENDEKALLLDHDYDGIHELNHPLPRWWVMTFYGTIIFAVCYAGYYMVGPGTSPRDDLDHSLAEIYAKRPKEEPIKFDEKQLQAAASPDHAKLGAKVFTTRCTPCHGPAGQGGIGPNLTDDFWLHGSGSIGDIAKVVHDGISEMGMPSWAEVLQPDEVKDVAAYVRSLRGTAPANPKAPQGTLQAATKAEKK
jgi:cytochrome c oxidase cbb3-type subunit 3